MNGWTTPRCEFYEVELLDPRYVSQEPHDVDRDDLTFYVPIPGGGAVRVHVCGRHLAVLEERYAGTP